MTEGFIQSNKKNILFWFLLILGASFHLFLGKLIFDNLRSVGIAFGIALSIVLILFGLHFTLGRKLYQNGGLPE